METTFNGLSKSVLNRGEGNCRSLGQWAFFLRFLKIFPNTMSFHSCSSIQVTYSVFIQHRLFQSSIWVCMQLRLFFSACIQNHVYVLVAHSCPTLCNLMDCSGLGFSVHGILQARILEWIAIPFSRASSRPRD